MALLLPNNPPPVDSLDYASKTIDRYSLDRYGKPKVYDASKVKVGADLGKSVQFLEGYINKYREAADALHAQKKGSNTDFPGLTARELDEITEGKGADYLKAVGLYNKYRKMTNKGATALGEKDIKSKLIGPSSFGGATTATEVQYYNPDAGASTLVRRSQIPLATTR